MGHRHLYASQQSPRPHSQSQVSLGAKQLSQAPRKSLKQPSSHWLLRKAEKVTGWLALPLAGVTLSPDARGGAVRAPADLGRGHRPTETLKLNWEKTSCLSIGLLNL